MRLLGVGLVLLSGCGLLLDLDPPDVDGGPRADAAESDAGLIDGATEGGEPDAADVGPDGPGPFDGGPPIDGGGCRTTSDCEVRNPGCGSECDVELGQCVIVDVDEDGSCDPLDVCIGGDIQYTAVDMACTTRALQVCDVESWVDYDFEEFETCSGTDQDCDSRVDDGLGIESCGIGACAGPRLCAADCTGSGGAPEVCSAPEEFGEDEDCDGRIDEECGGRVTCSPIFEASGGVIDGPGDYCLVVDSCDDASAVFEVSATALSDVRIHGDIQSMDGAAYQPCATVTEVPRSRLVVDGSLVIAGEVQATNVRFENGVGAVTPTLVVQSGGDFRGGHVGIHGGVASALVVAAGGTARLSDSRVDSSTSGHTIDSAGHLVIEASCDGRFDPLSRCDLDSPSTAGGVAKFSDGGSVIHLSGPSASLEMTAVRVFGGGSTAIWAENAGQISVFDSVLLSSLPEPVAGSSTHETVALEGCSGGIIRDSFVVNQGLRETLAVINLAVRAEDCPMRFEAPGVPLSAGRFHIAGSLAANVNATGVRCGDGCRFENINITGFARGATPSGRATAVGVDCRGTCDVAESVIVGNPSEANVETATGLRIASGTVLRSRLLGGNGMHATGLLSAAVGPVHLQDSVVVGFAGELGGAFSALEARGVWLQGASELSALHATIGARSWLRTPPVASLCRAIEADAEARAELVSTLLWAPCAGVGAAHSYYAPSAGGVVFMDHVGVAATSMSFLGEEVLSVDMPHETLLSVSDALELSVDYSTGTLPTGATEMITAQTVNGVPRTSSAIGAY